jgi:ankyrin repeat protein
MHFLEDERESISTKPRSDGGKQLQNAIRNQDHRKVIEFLQNDVDIEAKDENRRSAFSIAAGLGLAQIVETLLLFKAKIHLDGEIREALFVTAAPYGHIMIVRTFKNHELDEWDRWQDLQEARSQEISRGCGRAPPNDKRFAL